MSSQIDRPTRSVIQKSVLNSKRDARVVRQQDARTYGCQTVSESFWRKSSQESGRRDHFAAVVGVLLMSTVVLGGLKVFALLWANLGMIR
jgi:hypothetical protein